MKRINLFLIAALSLLLAACNTNEPNTGVQTCIVDDIEFSYFLKDTQGTIKSTFSQGEILVIWLNVNNKRNETINVNCQYFGRCYDNNNQVVEEMCSYIFPDTVPAYTTILPGDTRGFAYAIFADAPSGKYHYQDPYVSIYFNRKESTKKGYVIPLTLNFKVK